MKEYLTINEAAGYNADAEYFVWYLQLYLTTF